MNVLLYNIFISLAHLKNHLTLYQKKKNHLTFVFKKNK
jgi:hypothetical protein